MQQYILLHVNLDKFHENPGTFAHTYSYLHEQYKAVRWNSFTDQGISSFCLSEEQERIN